jgi:hypothetical protein
MKLSQLLCRKFLLSMNMRAKARDIVLFGGAAAGALACLFYGLGDV